MNIPVPEIDEPSVPSIVPSIFLTLAGIVISCKFVHPLKQLAEISSKFFGSSILVKEVQLLKTEYGKSFISFGKLMFSSCEHREKALLPSTVIVSGRLMVFKLEHRSNPLSPITVIVSGRLMVFKLVHPENPLAAICVTTFP